jgi:serine protease Do
MRYFPRLKPWVFLFVAALAVAGGLSVAVWRTRAADSLWTESHGMVTSGNPPWVTVAKKDTPAVVNISTTQVVRNPLAQLGSGDSSGDPSSEDLGRKLSEDLRRKLPGDMPQTLRAHSLGSGFIIRADGYIVTNNHLVEEASDIKVKLPDGHEFPARVVGRDEKTDLALLKINAQGLPVLAFGDSESLEVGQAVMAIGNPFGLEGTVTTGIVSAKGRVIGEGPYDDFIQTDASVNPGNSGGPLVNAAGQVVGINTAIASQSGGSVGIGFAIPISEAKAILPQLEANGRVTRGWLGVTIQPMTDSLAKALHLPEAKGTLVAQVMDASPAAKAGFQPGDVIVELDGHPVTKENDLPRLVAATPIGQDVAVKVIRNDQPVTLTAKVAEFPQQQRAAVPKTDRGQLGLKIQSLTPKLAGELGLKDQSGVVVAGVQNGGLAAEAGIRPGDVIVQVNRKPVHTVEEFRQAIENQQAGELALFLVHRKDFHLFMAVDVGGNQQG